MLRDMSAGSHPCELDVIQQIFVKVLAPTIMSDQPTACEKNSRISRTYIRDGGYRNDAEIKYEMGMFPRCRDTYKWGVNRSL